jgi:hypothetical protein
MAAVENFHYGKEVMALLLTQRADVPITEEMVVGIVRRMDETVVAILLEQRGADVQITEEVVEAAAGNWKSGRNVTTLLLNYQETDLQITKGMIMAAANNGGDGKEVMTLLLDRRGANAQIAEEVVIAVVEHMDEDEVALLLEQGDVQVTEEVIEAAEGRRHYNRDVIALLRTWQRANI